MNAGGGLSGTGFLLDEHVPLVIRTRLRQLAVGVRVYRVGDGVAPPASTPDPDLLVWIDDHDCLLVTNNRATMPVHLAAHLAQGRHVRGIVQLPERMNIGAVLDNLLLIRGAGLPDEFQDRITHLPL